MSYFTPVLIASLTSVCRLTGVPTTASDPLTSAVFLSLLILLISKLFLKRTYFVLFLPREFLHQTKPGKS